MTEPFSTDLHPDELLEDKARALKDEPHETNPDAKDWPDEVKTEPIIHEAEDDGSTVDHNDGE